MNLPFPSLTPRIIDSTWFAADSPCDEERDVSAMEQKYQSWMSLVSQQYSEVTALGRAAPEPMEEEAETDEDEGNDESDESEESHDEDEEEDLQQTYSPPRVNDSDAVDAPRHSIDAPSDTDIADISSGV